MKLHYHRTRFFLISITYRLFPSSKTLQLLHISTGIMLLSFMAVFTSCSSESEDENDQKSNTSRKQVVTGGITGDIFPDNTRVTCYDTTAVAPGSRSVKGKVIEKINTNPVIIDAVKPTCYKESRIDSNFIQPKPVDMPVKCYKKVVVEPREK
ncbi:MAG: hypothetical protein V2A54_09025 [Bacteroidota bacterium]